MAVRKASKTIMLHSYDAESTRAPCVKVCKAVMTQSAYLRCSIIEAVRGLRALPESLYGSRTRIPTSEKELGFWLRLRISQTTHCMIEPCK